MYRVLRIARFHTFARLLKDKPTHSAKEPPTTNAMGTKVNQSAQETEDSAEINDDYILGLMRKHKSVTLYADDPYGNKKKIDASLKKQDEPKLKEEGVYRCQGITIYLPPHMRLEGTKRHHAEEDGMPDDTRIIYPLIKEDKKKKE